MVVSAVYDNGKVQEVAYRIDGYLLFLIYNSLGVLEGKGLLVNFMEKKVYRLLFERGIMKEKKEEDSQGINAKVFDDNNFSDLIGETHSQALLYDVSRNDIRATKEANKLQVCFVNKGVS